MPGRTWIIAPDLQSLKGRWSRLLTEKHPEKKELLFHPHLRNNKPGDKHVRKALAEALSGQEERLDLLSTTKCRSLSPRVTAFDLLTANG